MRFSENETAVEILAMMRLAWQVVLLMTLHMVVRGVSLESAVNAPENSPAGELCGSCFGASDEAKGIKCCNTCDDVVKAYKEKGWSWPGEMPRE